MQVKYVAHDGKEFFDEAMCRAYEQLIEASKDSKFRKLVGGLFADCTSYADDGYGSNTAQVFYFSHMDKFIANLVRTLPALNDELQAAIRYRSKAQDKT